MSESNNSQRWLYKATYVPTQLNATHEGDLRRSRLRMQAFQNLNLVRSLDLQPAEIKRLRRRVERISDSPADRKTLRTNLDVINRLVDPQSEPAASNLNSAPLAAGLEAEALIQISQLVAEDRRRVAREVDGLLDKIQAGYLQYLERDASPVSGAEIVDVDGLEPVAGGKLVQAADLILSDSAQIAQAAGDGQPRAWQDALRWASQAQPGLARRLQSLVSSQLAQPLVLGTQALPLADDHLRSNLQQRVAIADLLARVFNERRYIEPVGRLYLERLEMTPVGVERGELIYSVPLAPQETVNITHKEWATHSEEFEKIVQDYFEGYSEEGVAEKNDVAMSTESQSRHSNALNFGASISGSYGTVTVSSSFGYSASSDEQQSRKDSRNRSMEVTRKASARTRKEHKVTFKVASAAGTEDQAVRIITNPSTTDAMRIDYYRMMRKWRTDLYRYGLRMTYDIVIPDPGAQLRRKLEAISSLDRQIDLPFRFALGQNSITRQNWAQLATIYGAKLDPPPEDTLDAYPHQVLEISMTDGDPAKTTRYGVFEINVPEGYTLKSAHFVANVTPWPQPWPTFFKLLDDPASPASLPNNQQSSVVSDLNWLIGESGKLAVGYTYVNFSTVSLRCALRFELKPVAYQAWQLAAWNTLRQAAEESYYQNLQRLREQREQLRDEVARVDTLTLRKMEREEIIKGVLRWLLGPAFEFVPKDVQAIFNQLETPVYEAFNGVVVNSGEKDSGLLQDVSAGDWQRVMEYGEFVKFINQAIEWENLIFFLYPYYWGSTLKWMGKRFLEHPDPFHRDFLRAGCARVVLTVRPGFEQSFTEMVETGAFGTLPGDHPYVTIAKEIEYRARTNYPGIPPANGEQHGRPLLYPEQQQAWDDMQKLLALLDSYQQQNGRYPTTAEGLAALQSLVPLDLNVGFDPIRIESVPLNDPWGNPFHYACPGTSGAYDLICYGKDGQPGGAEEDPYNADISSAAEASLIASWYDYTPTAALDIQLTTVAPA